ncbi:MAG TPA: cephalosporin hydroxylase [Rickettsia endosymbiont of Proechinophthirus fluctus]|uniref:cephalosporin hydroxylase n=1 Tax=Rickettsia endosymbiont of Proechinophthirus fluctus TaxID=1462733 RepID=UPI000A8F2BDD|nr:cephalosporin hydroxylase [Rickettsia endosymbiont of Proechinophthirus fluctus]HJD54777.1 cephalosporin hydroxylase [Rickettsia endosymbiont of Proechinophthirus fluctus]
MKENKDLYLVDTKYVNYTKEIKDTVNNNAEIIHIKNIDQKNYNIMIPYDGEVRISGIEELICHMYGVIGIIGSLPVLYKEDKNIISAVAPRRNSHNEHSSQSPYND